MHLTMLHPQANFDKPRSCVASFTKFDRVVGIVERGSAICTTKLRENKMAQTAPVGRSEKPGDKINWFTAPPVPVRVMQMKNPAGEIITGPGGQKPIVVQSVIQRVMMGLGTTTVSGLTATNPRQGIKTGERIKPLATKLFISKPLS